MRCLICGSESFELFHKGTRDNPNVNVMKCIGCNSFQLSSFAQIYDGFYEDGNMRKDQYSVSQNTYSDQLWDSWIAETKEDDCRRAVEIEKIIEGGCKAALDFGCGNGGYLRELRKKGIVNNIIGVELDKEARTRLSNEEIAVYERLGDIDQTIKFDVVTMFQVIEHLEEPHKIIIDIKNRLIDGGLLIIETPNVEDALISKYHSKSFMDFTFWSEHLFLYNTSSLERLMLDCEFSVVDNGQLQRYPLANHLHWLAENKPGGHAKWREFNVDLLNKAYADILRKTNQCDTLFGVFRKSQ